MPVESGHYIITNSRQKNVAFLPDSNDGSPVVGRDERGSPGEVWDVKALKNGHHSIINLHHKRYAVTKQRAASGETVEGRDDDHQWLIRKTSYSGEYTIATIDTWRVWGLEDNYLHTPVTLSDRSSDQRFWWSFKKVDSEDIPDADPTPSNAEVTAARRLAEQEMTRRKEVEAELARQTAELKAVKGDLEVTRKLAEMETARREEAEAKLDRQRAELRGAKGDLEVARELAETETTRRNAAEVEVRMKTEESKAAKRDLGMARKQLRTETTRREDAEAELARHAAELKELKGEAAWASKIAVDERPRRKATGANAVKVARRIAEEETAASKGAEAEDPALPNTSAYGKQFYTVDSPPIPSPYGKPVWATLARQAAELKEFNGEATWTGKMATDASDWRKAAVPTFPTGRGARRRAAAARRTAEEETTTSEEAEAEEPALVLALPIPSPDKQTIFPVRQSMNANVDFTNNCFLHREDGRMKRMHLLNFLSSDWWWHQRTAPSGKLDSFAETHGPRNYECGFCATHYGTLARVMTCIQAHIDYHP